jgi:hypothetical protein
MWSCLDGAHGRRVAWRAKPQLWITLSVVDNFCR